MFSQPASLKLTYGTGRHYSTPHNVLLSLLPTLHFKHCVRVLFADFVVFELDNDDNDDDDDDDDDRMLWRRLHTRRSRRKWRLRASTYTTYKLFLADRTAARSALGCLSVCLPVCIAVHCGAQGRCMGSKVVPSCF